MKKIFAMLLVLTMLFACLTACAKTETPATDTQEPETTTDASAETTPTPAEEKEEPVTVKWVLRTDAQEDDDEVLAYLNELLLEKGNVQLELIPVSSGEYDTRCQLITTGGEDYDLMFTCNWTNSFNANMQRGSFLALDDILASDDGALLRESVPSFLFSASTVDGKIYAVPNYQVMANQLCIVMQKEYVDKYGFDISTIKTVTDVEPFLQTLVENEPDMIPMCETDSFISAGVNNKKDAPAAQVFVYAADDTHTPVLAVDDEDNINWYRTMNEWYKKGYLRSDLATVTDNTADLVANRYVCRITQYKPGIETEILATYGKEYVAAVINTPYVQYTQPIGTMNAVNVNSAHPEAALKLLGLFYSDEEVYNTFMYGIEGKHYSKTGDNRVEQIPNSGYSRADIGWEYGNQFNQWLLPTMADDTWTLTQEMNDSAMPSPLMGFTCDRSSFETEYANVVSTVKEYEKGILTADDFDGYWDEFRTALIAAGIETVRDSVQEQISAWAAANGK